MISPTESDTKMKKQTISIYEALIKIGFPGIVDKKILKEVKDIQELLSQYFQPTPKRQNLIQWLILQIYPLYQDEIDKNDKTKNKKRRILSYLWKLGILPFSKHTKNLDYQKYLEGLIGYQNSINLIFNLCIFAIEQRRKEKSKEDTQFHYFIEDIFKNYDSLINLQYDPYKISFPQAYHNLDEGQFNQKYEFFLEKIAKIRENKIEFQQKQHPNTSFQSLFKSFQQNKNQFQKAYTILLDKIKKVTTQSKNIVQNWQQQSQNNEQKNRMIEIAPSLPKLYKQYKQKIKFLSFSTSKMIEQKQKIIQVIKTFNEKVIL